MLASRNLILKCLVSRRSVKNLLKQKQITCVEQNHIKRCGRVQNESWQTVQTSNVYLRTAGGCKGRLPLFQIWWIYITKWQQNPYIL